MGTRAFLACATALSTALILIPNAGAVRIGEVPLEPGSGPTDLVTGSDGNLFVTEDGADRVDRVRPDGGIIGQFGLPVGSNPIAIAAGPDGNLWVAEFTAKKIARVTTAGGVGHFPAGTTAGSPLGIAAGPDGNIWIAELGPDRIGRLPVSGIGLQEFVTSGGPRDIVAGPDGNLWFTKATANAIGRITPAGALLPDFTAGISPGASPNSIALGPDGNLWFTEASGIGRITPAGAVTEFSLVPNDDPSSRITAGPDGNLWFTQFNDDRVGRITPDGTITLYTQGITANGTPGHRDRTGRPHLVRGVQRSPARHRDPGATDRGHWHGHLDSARVRERDRHGQSARLPHDGQVRVRAHGGVRQLDGSVGAGGGRHRRGRARRAHRTDAAVDRSLPCGRHERHRDDDGL